MSKNKMSLRSYITLIAVLFIAIITPSCEKDKVSTRDNFLGAYSVVETCGGGNDSYNLTIITSGSSENAVVVDNLYNADDQISGIIDGNSLSILSQQGDQLTYSGTGTLSDKTLTINFTISNSTNSDNCIATCTRK